MSGVLAVLLPVAFLVLRNPKETEAASWYNDDWLYRKQIDISYSGTDDLIDYQVELQNVDVDGLNGEGKLQDACEDLRFVSHNGDLLDFWIYDEAGANDNIDCNGPSDRDIWVKIPSIPEGGATIFMYYGNSTAQGKSNGVATFDFFDDFQTPKNTT